MKKLNITFCSFPDYSSNAKPLYEYMKKKYNDNMNLVWIVNSDEKKKQLKSNGINCYKLGTKEYYNYIKKSDIIFSTHANLTADKPENCIYIELWHGIGMKPIGYLSKNFTNEDKEWYKYITKKIDYFIVPSEMWRVIFSSMFNYNASRILSLGYPKLDDIKNKNSKKYLEKICPYYKKFDKIIYYMPTFRKGLNRTDTSCNLNNIFNLEEYDENRLIDFLEKNNYLLCIKYHPSEENLIKKVVSNNIFYIEDKILSNKNITISELLDASDLLITDYSSLGVEYTFLDKPVVYLSYNLKNYQKNRGIVFENFGFWTKNLISSDLENLMKVINESLIKEKVLNESKELYFGNLKNGGCKNICDYFIENNQIKKTIKRYVSEEIRLENVVQELIQKEVIYKEKIDNLKIIEENYNKATDKIKELIDEKKQLQEIITKIYNSKSWKIISFIRNIKNWRKK